MSENNYSNQNQYTEVQYALPEAQPAPEQKKRTVSSAGSFFSLPARIGMWIVGVIAGVTILFGCGIFWVWGLDYIGVIDTGKSVNDGTNEFNQPDYDEYEEFYDYFGGYPFFGYDDFFGGSGSEEGGSQNDTPQGSTPGIGVTIQQIELDFAVEDTYTAGLVIVEIRSNGALAGTEARIGDLIVAVNGQPCPTIDDLDKFLIATGVGGEMTLTLARFSNGVATTFEIEITLIDMSAISN